MVSDDGFSTIVDFGLARSPGRVIVSARAGRLDRMHRTTRRSAACAALILIATAGVVHAQVVANNWTTEQGLPQNVVRALHQTDDGYLWVVTMDGIARFDGVRFTVFNRANTPGLETNRFTAIYESAAGELWFGSESGAIRYHGGMFTTYATEAGLPHRLITGITGDEQGNVWFLANGQVARWQSGRFVPEPRARPGLTFARSAWRSDAFYGSDGQTIHRFVGGAIDHLPLPASLQGRAIEHIAEEESGTLWVSGNGVGLAVLNDGRVVGSYSAAEIKSGTDGGNGRVPEVDYTDRTGRTWRMRVDSQLNRILTVAVDGRTESLSFTALYGDREGSLWLATFNRGLYQVRVAPLTVLSRASGLAGQTVYPVLEDRTGAVWLGVWQAGLSRVWKGTVENFSLRDGLPSLFATALAEDSAGKLWVAGHARHNGGLAILEDRRFVPVASQIVPDETVIAAIHHASGGLVWFGTNRGLFRYDGERVSTYSSQNGLAGDDVKAIIDDGAGGLWVGGSGGVTHVRERAVTRWTEREGLPSPNVRALYRDAEDVLWIGTYDGGLARLKNDRIARFTTRDGLFNDGVFQIVEDDSGHFWIGCNRGIYRISRQELNESAEGTTRSIGSLVLGTGDGLLNAEANGGYWPAGARTRDGRVWIPTQDGVAVVDPKRFGSRTTPVPALIETVLVDRAPIEFAQGVRVGPQPQSVEIHYTALSFINARHLRFRYRLSGLDDEWVDAGTRRTAYYSHVPAGSYRFDVMAATTEGIWSSTPASMAVTVVPPFWRQWWFSVAAVCLVLTAVTVAHRRRMSALGQARIAQEAFSRQLIASQEQERKRIASELHDGLGQSLIVMRNWAALGASQLAPDAPGREELDEVALSASRAIGEMREMAQNLAPYALERLGLAESLSEMIERVQRSSGIEFTHDLAALNAAIGRDVEMTLYRVAQEAMNNILKHSHATRAHMALGLSGSSVRLTIEDNGHGFDRSQASSGMGLSSMAERIRLFDGEYVVRTGEGRGTTIEVTVRSHTDHGA